MQGTFSLSCCWLPPSLVLSQLTHVQYTVQNSTTEGRKGEGAASTNTSAGHVFTFLLVAAAIFSPKSADSEDEYTVYSSVYATSLTALLYHFQLDFFYDLARKKLKNVATESLCYPQIYQ